MGRELRHPGPGSWLKEAGVATSSHVTLLLGPTVDSSSRPASPHSYSTQPGIDSIFLLSLERISQATTWAKPANMSLRYYYFLSNWT